MPTSKAHLLGAREDAEERDVDCGPAASMVSPAFAASELFARAQHNDDNAIARNAAFRLIFITLLLMTTRQGPCIAEVYNRSGLTTSAGDRQLCSCCRKLHKH